MLVMLNRKISTIALLAASCASAPILPVAKVPWADGRSVAVQGPEDVTNTFNFKDPLSVRRMYREAIESDLRAAGFKVYDGDQSLVATPDLRLMLGKLDVAQTDARVEKDQAVLETASATSALPCHSGLETKVRENMECYARAVVTKLVESEKVAAALHR